MAKQRPKIGRPSAGRDELMQIRLSPEEKEAFGRAAQYAGLSLSDWARLCLRARSISDLEAAGDKAPFAKLTATTGK